MSVKAVKEFAVIPPIKTFRVYVVVCHQWYLNVVSVSCGGMTWSIVRAMTVVEHERKHTLILRNPFVCIRPFRQFSRLVWIVDAFRRSNSFIQIVWIVDAGSDVIASFHYVKRGKDSLPPDLTTSQYRGTPLLSLVWWSPHLAHILGGRPW